MNKIEDKELEKVVEDLEGKYGAININLEDGTYTKVDQDG